MNLARIMRLVLLASVALVGCNCASRGTAGESSSLRQTANNGPEAEVIGSQVLGGPPLCEASALVRIGTDFVVADNELADRLFRFDRDMVPLVTWAMPRSDRPRDIEALAYDGERLLVVGSHSPKKDGSRQPRRHRTRLLAVDHGALTPIAAFETGNIEQDLPSCIRGLFGDESNELASSEEATSFCAALVQGGSMNVEGATVIAGRFWVGFRWPLVDGKAVMGRLEGSGALRFDQLRLVDLAGLGIRAMDASLGELYLIGGPKADADTAHTLFRVDTNGRAESVMELPTSSEGLALVGDGEAVVVIDGAEGRRETECSEPARWIRARW